MAKQLPLPPTPEAMAELTAEQLHELASAVVAEQHRRAGPKGRIARTQAATAARLAAQANDPDARRRQTAAAVAARKRLAEERRRAAGG